MVYCLHRVGSAIERPLRVTPDSDSEHMGLIKGGFLLSSLCTCSSLLVPFFLRLLFELKLLTELASVAQATALEAINTTSVSTGPS